MEHHNQIQVDDNINRLRNNLKQNHSVSFFKNKDALASNVILASLNLSDIREQSDDSEVIRIKSPDPLASYYNVDPSKGYKN